MTFLGNFVWPRKVICGEVFSLLINGIAKKGKKEDINHEIGEEERKRGLSR
jgi:hypothetical protein